MRSRTRTVQEAYQKLLDSGLVEIEALCFIRGRSIARRFFILDEAQQLTPHEVKTVITRISKVRKLFSSSDPDQIDNPYVIRGAMVWFIANRMRARRFRPCATNERGAFAIGRTGGRFALRHSKTFLLEPL